ncbi:MAG: glycosyltransferase [Thiotrichaceae bacterium]|nr:glycosyltransferase [Thiotrichaceae bacterium]
MTSQPRVLLSAYQCGPGMGSVSQIGWQWYSRLAAKLPVTLVTHVRNREALENAGAPLGDSHIIYIDTEWFAAPLYNFSSRLFPKSQHSVFLLSSLDYYVYDREVIKQLKNQASNWDVIHAPTPVSPNAATRLYKLGLPVVVGPWNGGIKNPENFPEIMKQDAMWLYPLRNLGKLTNKALGGTRNASKILVANQTTMNTVPKAHQAKCEILLENAVDLDLFAAATYPVFPSTKLKNPLELVYVGRLVPFKGVSMLLEAIAQVKDKLPIHLTVIGEGPLAHDWQLLADNLGISQQVDWFGAADVDDIVDKLHAAHAFCLPSVRESGGAVLLEAMSCARPVIAIAFGGPAEVVDEEVGHAIPPDGKDVVIKEFVNTFYSLFKYPETWQRRGEVGRQRAEQYYSWHSKINHAIQIYQDLTQKPL